MDNLLWTNRDKRGLIKRTMTLVKTAWNPKTERNEILCCICEKVIKGVKYGTGNGFTCEGCRT